METIDLIQELSETFGVSGYEGEARDALRRHLGEIADIEVDGLGSLIARLKGGLDRPRVMVAAHMDEIGFMVSHISKDGFVYFRELGGWVEHVLLAQRVRIKTGAGELTGVIGSKPPHIMDAEERKKVIKSKEMFIDVGAGSDEEAAKLGVRPGDPIAPHSGFTRLNGSKIMGKAFDDRLGCAAMIQTMRSLSGKELACSVYGVGTVQEEVGLRGARTSASFVEPDLGLVSEVALAGDTPGIKETEVKAKLGKGPVITVFDRSLIPNPRLRDFVMGVAEDEKIPYQLQASAGGTDGGHISLHGSGVPSIVVGIPTRYIHSHVAVADASDVEQAVDLLTAVIRSVDANVVEEIKR
ncbi:MAG: M42 family metallopeptidase [Candidatus Aquicultorales bacterium]